MTGIVMDFMDPGAQPVMLRRSNKVAPCQSTTPMTLFQTDNPTANIMWLLDQLAEQHIQAALERGELDNLPGAGRPLALDDDDPLIPADQRMAYKILKNAGYVPAEVSQRKEAAELRDELRQTHDESERRRIAARLDCLLMRLDAGRRDRTSLLLRSEYYSLVLDRMTERRGTAAQQTGCNTGLNHGPP